jgi:phosphatidylserine/phosphatidylglycerophosphate/cardiolipin synthase-like enzyme
MQSEAVFENIGIRIQQEIAQAEESIVLAVAWFTNKDLFEALIEKAKENCKVSLIISKNEINQNSSIDYDELNINRSIIYRIGNSETELIHNKFCIIDNNTIITGSYNWSYKAENNFENIVITKGDTTLAQQFVTEFNDIRKQYFPDKFEVKDDFSLDKIIKRLRF